MGSSLACCVVCEHVCSCSSLFFFRNSDINCNVFCVARVGLCGRRRILNCHYRTVLRFPLQLAFFASVQFAKETFIGSATKRSSARKCSKDKFYWLYKKVHSKYNVMTFQSDNQVIAACARAQQRRRGRFDGGQWNGWQRQAQTMNGVGGGFSCGFNESVRVNR